MNKFSIVYKKINYIAERNKMELENWLGIESGEYEKILFDIDDDEDGVRIYILANNHQNFSNVKNEIEQAFSSSNFIVNRKKTKNYDKLNKKSIKEGCIYFVADDNDHRDTDFRVQKNYLGGENQTQEPNEKFWSKWAKAPKYICPHCGKLGFTYLDVLIFKEWGTKCRSCGRKSLMYYWADFLVLPFLIGFFIFLIKFPVSLFFNSFVGFVFWMLILNQARCIPRMIFFKHIQICKKD